MGSAVYPAPSTGGAAFPGAGSLAASAYTTKLWWSTTLSAGTYIFYGTPSGSPTILRDQATGFDSNRNYASTSPSGTGATGSVFSLGSYDQVLSTGILENSPAVFKLTASSLVQFTCSWKIINNLSDRGMWNLANNPNHGTSNNAWDNGVTSDYVLIGSYNRDGNGYRHAIVPHLGPVGYAHHTVEIPTFHLSTDNNEGLSLAAHWNSKFYIGYGTGSTSNKFYSSTDGTNFSDISPTGLQNSPSSMMWSGQSLSSPNANYVVTSDSSSANNHLASSTDGVTWTTRASGQTGKSLYGTAFSTTLSRWVVVGTGGACSTSADGITWTARTMPGTSHNYYSLIFNPTVGKFLAVAGSRTAAVGGAALSTDGITWTGINISAKNVTSNTTIDSTLNGYWMSAQSADGKMHIVDGNFTMYNSQGYLWTSTDGITWSVSHMGINFNSSAYMNTVSYGPSIWFPRISTDDYNGGMICYAQPAIYQVYNSAIV